MSWTLILEQSLNGLQFGLMLFLLAAGLTLVFGIMDMINLAHGSLYMLGAFLAATLVQATGSFALGVLLAIPATALIGMLLEVTVLRTLYARDHLSQVLATFALILILNEAVRIVWGSDMPLSTPAALSGPVELLPGMPYPSYRLLIIAVGLAVAGLLYLLVAKTRIGMLGARAHQPDGARDGWISGASSRWCSAPARRCARSPARCSGRCSPFRSAWASPF